MGHKGAVMQDVGTKPVSDEAALPEFGGDGFFGIRLESIGGLGAHLAGQILAEAAVLRQGLNGAHFSSYGSEKKGSPVRSYVRLCAADQQLRTSSPVDRPQVIAVFHEALAVDRSVLAGRDELCAVVVNSVCDPAVLRGRLGLAEGTLGAVNAWRIASEEGSRVNTVMLGAIARVSPVPTCEALEETIRATFAKNYSHLVEANLRAFRRGYDGLALHTLSGDGGAEAVPARPAAAFGYLDAPLGGMVINPGNTILKDLTSSRRGYVPAFDRSACVDCGLCDLACPDLCFVWGTEEAADGRTFIRLRGIDYQYCKGCLKCVDACPTMALTEVPEEGGYAAVHTVHLFPWLVGDSAPRGGRVHRNGAGGGAK